MGRAPAVENSRIKRAGTGKPRRVLSVERHTKGWNVTEHLPTGDAQLASELRVSLARLHRRMVTERHPENPLSIAAMAVLGALYRNGALPVGELAAHEHVQPPSMTRTVTTLEQAGFVIRTPHANDGRAVLVSLTIRGREQLLKDRRQRDAWLARRLRELSPEERKLLGSAASILEALSRSAEK
jgi:DNA-binding MarR family transcriptional regulator